MDVLLEEEEDDDVMEVGRAGAYKQPMGSSYQRLVAQKGQGHDIRAMISAFYA